MVTESTHSRLSRVVHATLVVLAFGLLAWLIWRNSDKIRDILGRRLDLKLLALGLLIALIGMLGTFVRWFLLLRVIEPRFSFNATLLLGIIGVVFNSVIPGAVGGDLIKAGYLARMEIKKTQAIASMVIDRIVGLLGLFSLASMAGVSAWRVAPAGVRPLIVSVWVGLAFGGLALAALFSRAFVRIFSAWPSGRSRLGVLVAELREMSTTYRRRPDILLVCVGLSVLTQGLGVLAFYLVGRMLFPAMGTTLAQHLLIVPLIFFSMALPLPFGALGVSEEVGDQLFTLVGHPSGFLAMVGFRVLTYLSTLVCACVYLARLNEVRRLTEQGSD